MTQLRLPGRRFWLGAAALTLLRCLPVLFQQGYTWVGGAPLDDELMFRAAQSISAGQWLGAYDYLTLSKAMFFPVWLALLHALHIPYLLGGTLLWCAAALAAARAFAPMVKTDGRQLLLYGLLAFAPSSWAAYTLRVYRDNIFPALCLLFFAGFCAAALRVLWYPRAGAGDGAARPAVRVWPWLLLGGAALAAAYLDREDAGLFLLPFAAVATAVMAVLLARQRRWLALAAQALPYAVLAAGVAAFCGLNARYYGVAALSDFSSGSFADAVGAMTRVDTASDEPLLSVPADARALLYEAVPALEPLRYWLEEDAQLQNDFRDPELDDYRAGSFYWAIRRAAQFEGYYADAQTAEAYWAEVAAQVNAACDDGTLPTRSGPRSGTAQPIRLSYVPATLAETAKGFLHTLVFADCKPFETQRSIGAEEDIALWSSYLGCSFNAAAEAGKDTPYYSPNQKLVFAVLRLWRGVAAVLLPFAFVCALVWQFRALPAVLRSRSAGRILPWLLLFGLLGMALLRCAMIAFVEVSSFGIGTSTMYLASVHPLLILYTVLGVLYEA